MKLSIYLYIWSDESRGEQLFQHLRRKGKAYQSRSKKKQAGREPLLKTV